MTGRLEENGPTWPTQVVMKNRTVPAAMFKAHCLSLLDELARSRAALVITKRGRPVVRVVPLARSTRRRKLVGRILGDIVSPIEAGWIA